MARELQKGSPKTLKERKEANKSRKSKKIINNSELARILAEEYE